MESFNSLVESFCRIFCKKSLKVAKGYCAFIKVLRLFHPVIASGICNEFIGSPVFSFRIYIIGFFRLLQE